MVVVLAASTGPGGGSWQFQQFLVVVVLAASTGPGGGSWQLQQYLVVVVLAASTGPGGGNVSITSSPASVSVGSFSSTWWW